MIAKADRMIDLLHMKRYIIEIRTHGLYDLADFRIPVADDECPHLVITGPNGSGKTVLLNGVRISVDSHPGISVITTH